MASAAQVNANRANASRSTGPAETSRTRFNGLAHGLTSKQTVIRGERQEEYDTFHKELLGNLTPKSPLESVLAERVIVAAWRLKRFARVETSFFNDRIDAFLSDNPDGNSGSALANLFSDPEEITRMRLFMRYQLAVQREYDTAIREFKIAQRARMDVESSIATVSLRNRIHSLAQPSIGFASHIPQQPPFASAKRRKRTSAGAETQPPQAAAA